MSKEFKVEFGPVTHQNVDCLKMLVNKTFPLTYSDSLYAKIATEYKEHSMLAYLEDIPVGGISCRENERNGGKSLYVIILSVLPKYRRGHIATQLVQEVIKLASKNKELKSIFLHTPVGNSTAIEFYKKNGFHEAETEEGYYKSFETAQDNRAIVLERML